MLELHQLPKALHLEQNEKLQNYIKVTNEIHNQINTLSTAMIDTKPDKKKKISKYREKIKKLKKRLDSYTPPKIKSTDEILQGKTIAQQLLKMFNDEPIRAIINIDYIQDPIEFKIEFKDCGKHTIKFDITVIFQDKSQINSEINGYRIFENPQKKNEFLLPPEDFQPEIPESQFIIQQIQQQNLYEGLQAVVAFMDRKWRDSLK